MAITIDSPDHDLKYLEHKFRVTGKQMDFAIKPEFEMHWLFQGMVKFCFRRSSAGLTYRYSVKRRYQIRTK